MVAEEGVLRAYRAATGEAAADAGSSVNGRKPVEGDCPICFNELEVGLQLCRTAAALNQSCLQLCI